MNIGTINPLTTLKSCMAEELRKTTQNAGVVPSGNYINATKEGGQVITSMLARLTPYINTGT